MCGWKVTYDFSGQSIYCLNHYLKWLLSKFNKLYWTYNPENGFCVTKNKHTGNYCVDCGKKCIKLCSVSCSGLEKNFWSPNSISTYIFFSKPGSASQRSIAAGAMLRSPTTITLLPWLRSDCHRFYNEGVTVSGQSTAQVRSH